MTLFITLHVLICIVLTILVLLQPAKADAGIGFGSSSQSIFGSKGASNFLTKTTSTLAVLYLLTSFVLTRSRIQQYSSSVIKNEPAQSHSTGANPAPKAPAPAAKGEPSKAPSPAK